VNRGLRGAAVECCGGMETIASWLEGRLRGPYEAARRRVSMTSMILLSFGPSLEKVDRNFSAIRRVAFQIRSTVKMRSARGLEVRESRGVESFRRTLRSSLAFSDEAAKSRAESWEKTI